MHIKEYHDYFITMMTEVPNVSDEVDTPMKLTIKEKNIVLLQKLEMNNMAFQKNLSKRITKGDNIYQITENNKTTFYIQTGEQPDQTLDKPVVKSRWDMLGVYEPITKEDNSKVIVWVWAWHLFEESTSMTELKDCLKNLPTGMQPLENRIVESNDSMLVSYIFAYLTGELSLEHIYVRQSEEGHFTAFGMRNLEWCPIPETMESETPEVPETPVQE
jgi:hypothetical protein